MAAEFVSEALGVQVVEAGCDAQLTAEMSAGMIPADYRGVGRCCEGFEGTAVATLSMPERADAVGFYEDHDAPPDVVSESSCSRSPSVTSLVGRT